MLPAVEGNYDNDQPLPFTIQDDKAKKHLDSYLFGLLVDLQYQEFSANHRFSQCTHTVFLARFLVLGRRAKKEFARP